MKPSVPKLAWDFIDRQEGNVLKAYWDTDGWAIGRGIHAPDVNQNTVWTAEESDQRFQQRLQEIADGICPHIVPELTDPQLAACESLTWNLKDGIRKFIESTLLKLINEGEPRKAADEFPKWDHQTDKTGKVTENEKLLARRNKERELFLSGTNLPVVQPDITKTPPVVEPPVPVRVGVGVKMNPLTVVQNARPVTKIILAAVAAFWGVLQDPNVQRVLAHYAGKHAHIADAIGLIATIAALMHQPQKAQ